MARGLGMTALRAALGGVGGYYEGVGAEREAKRLEEQQRQALERQRELDRIGMLREGFTTPEAQGAAKQTGGAAVLRAALTGARDQSAIDQGLSAAAPQQTATLGGQTFTRETPFSKAAREASRALYEEQQKKERERTESQQAFSQRVQELVAAGMTPQQATAFARTGSAAFAPLSAADKARQSLDERRFGLEARRVALAEQQAQEGAGGGRATGRGAAATDKLSLQATLPNVIKNAEAFINMTPEQVRKMSPGRMDARSTAMASEGAAGLAMRGGQRLVPGMKMTPQEERYLSMANAVADAVSRATDIGVQSNFDVRRFRDQVKPLAGDSPEEMEAKFRQVQGWAQWLVNHRKTLETYDAAYEAGKPLQTIKLQGPSANDGVSEETQAAKIGRFPTQGQTKSVNPYR
jgi:hypothetical protein